MKNNLLLNLIIGSAILFGNNAYSQTNIATTASKVTTSFVSSWEKLSAVNDGYEPANSGDKSHNAYGNWQSADIKEVWNWVEYDFDKYYRINSSSVYWWTDGGGIQIPYSTYLEYWNIFQNKWLKIESAAGNGIKADQYNVTAFDTLLTNKIRVYSISTQSTGILEWKVFGSVVENVPVLSTVTKDVDLAKSTTSNVTLKAIDKSNIILQGYVFKLLVKVNDLISDTNEQYTINGIGITNDTILSLSQTDASGNAAFSITLPAVFDPNDGINIGICLNDGKTKFSELAYKEEGLQSPVLNADATENTVDNTIEISFSDNANWRTSITAVKSDNKTLETNDYEISAGIIILKPSSGNGAITKAGSKIIVVEALGYKDATITQEIKAGVINAQKSGINKTYNIFRPSVSNLEILAADQFGNPISGYSFKWSARAVNNNGTTSEVYIVNDIEIKDGSVATGQTLAVTNEKGISTIKVAVPAIVDINDGVNINIFLSDGTTSVGKSIEYKHIEGEKSVYVAMGIKAVKDWSWDKTAQSENFILFWGSLTGPDPKKPLTSGTGFDPDAVLEELEGFLNFYADTMGFIPNRDSGNMSKYKFIIVMNNTWANNQFQGNTPTGGSWDGVIGSMWIPPTAAGGFVAAHEFAHMMCAMIPIQYPGHGIADPASGVIGMFWEGTANYMAYLATGALGNISPSAFINTAMMQYQTTLRHYETAYYPLFLCDQYGFEGFARFWRKSKAGVHPFDVLTLSEGYTKDQAMDKAGLYAMKTFAMDFKFRGIGKNLQSIIKGYSSNTILREFTYLDTIKDMPGRYIVPRQMAPADYGYNAIPVFPNTGAAQIKVRFYGYENAPAKGAGWRYGFVAKEKNGTVRYSDVYSEKNNEVIFNINPEDSSIFLVVIATPAVSHNYEWSPNWPKIYRYPYTLEFEGALPAGYKPGYNTQNNGLTGAPHANGGGWVESTATVAASAYVGPNAQVLGKAAVSDDARIEGFAIVRDNAKVQDNAIVRDNCIVGTTSNIYGNAVIEKSARVFATTVFDNAVVSGSAVLFSCKLYGKAVAKDLAWLSNTTLSGSAIVGGDIESHAACSQGVYLQTVRTSCDKKEWPTGNNDNNPDIEDYIYPAGSIPTNPNNLEVSDIQSNSAIVKWNEAEDDFGINSYIVFNTDKTVLGRFTTTMDTITGLTANKEYTIVVKAVDVAGNISTASNEVTFTTLETGISNAGMLADVKVYPNPVADYVNIEISDNGTSQVAISDCLGRNVYESSFSGNAKIQKQAIGSSGIYYLIITNDKGKYIQKISIQ